MSLPPGYFTIRNDCLSDVSAIESLLSLNSISETGGCEPFVIEEHLVANMMEQRHDDEVGFVACIGCTLLGYVALSKPNPHPRRSHVAEISIAVHPSVWRQGIGRQLLHKALDFAKKTSSIQRIEIHVFESEKAAIALYQNLGFKIEGCMVGHTLLRGEYANVLAMAYWLHND